MGTEDQQDYSEIPGITKTDVELASSSPSNTANPQRSFHIFLMLSHYSSQAHGGCPLAQVAGQRLVDVLI